MKAYKAARLHSSNLAYGCPLLLVCDGEIQNSKTLIKQ